MCLVLTNILIKIGSKITVNVDYWLSCIGKGLLSIGLPRLVNLKLYLLGPRLEGGTKENVSSCQGAVVSHFATVGQTSGNCCHPTAGDSAWVENITISALCNSSSL